MRTWFFYFWESLRTSYWFVPTVVCVISVLLAFAAIELDRAMHRRAPLESVWWVYSGGPEGVRAVLSTLAGSMITVAGVVFSITIVALTLACGQFGPRLFAELHSRPRKPVRTGDVYRHIHLLLAGAAHRARKW